MFFDFSDMRLGVLLDGDRLGRRVPSSRRGRGAPRLRRTLLRASPASPVRAPARPASARDSCCRSARVDSSLIMASTLSALPSIFCGLPICDVSMSIVRPVSTALPFLVGDPAAGHGVLRAHDLAEADRRLRVDHAALDHVLLGLDLGDARAIDEADLRVRRHVRDEQILNARVEMSSNSACAGPSALFWNVKTTTTGRLSCAPATIGSANAPAASAVTICFANDFVRNMVSSRDSDLFRPSTSFLPRPR